MTNSLKCAAILFTVIEVCSFAQTVGPELLIAQRFRDKIFLIRGWYQDGKLTYDAAGSVVGQAHSGPWTTSGVQILSVRAEPNAIVFKGRRVGYVYDRDKREFVPLRPSRLDGMTITIEKDPRMVTSSDLDALENAIFVEKPRGADVPEYWREFLTHADKATTQDPARGAQPGDQQNPPADSPADQKSSNSAQGSAPTSSSGGHETAPRLLRKTADPTYNKVAEHAGLHGTSLIQVIVNTDGEPTQPRILRPLGLGLDEAAIEAVSHWRFAPAIRDGKPVAVTLQIEVNFRR